MIFHAFPRPYSNPLHARSPEKNHSMQLSVFSELINAHPEHGPDAQHPVRLVVIGGSRTPADDERVRELREMSKALGIDVRFRYIVGRTELTETTQAQVEFIVNASYAVILEWLSRASVGLSTMVDEHFGINIVEFMVSSQFCAERRTAK
jgi:alpha-1,2-mannosyltransferase